MIDSDLYVDLVSPGFVHVTDRRLMKSFYEVPADPSVPRSCCPRAILVSRLEFTWITNCQLHGERSGGNSD